MKDETIDWDKEHGTRVEIELVAAYRGGRTGVQEYLEQTVVANPHLALTWVSPKGERFEFPRVTHELPREAQEIKPHPHGVELGMLQMMMQDSGTKTVKQVLVDDFSRVSPAVAQQVCELAKVSPKARRREAPRRGPRAAAQGARRGEGAWRRRRRRSCPSARGCSSRG